jgi:hypothetical protein
MIFSKAMRPQFSSQGTFIAAVKRVKKDGGR